MEDPNQNYQKLNDQQQVTPNYIPPPQNAAYPPQNYPPQAQMYQQPPPAQYPPTNYPPPYGTPGYQQPYSNYPPGAYPPGPYPPQGPYMPPPYQQQQPNIEIKIDAGAVVNQSNNQQVTQKTQVVCADGSKSSVLVHCNNCNNDVYTRVEFYTGSGAILCCVILCFTVPFCFCLPFINQDCKSARHFCPNCKASLGVTEYTLC